MKEKDNLEKILNKRESGKINKTDKNRDLLLGKRKRKPVVKITPSTIGKKRSKEEVLKNDLVETIVSFRDVDLRGADLRGADLIEVMLSGKNLEGADLKGADLLGAIMPKS